MRILFIVLFALLSGPAHAFENIKQWQQVDIESDKLLYFKDKKIIQAKGDVVIKKDFDKLFAIMPLAILGSNNLVATRFLATRRFFKEA
jgi:lipopolysaccharide export system protein LptA